MLKPCMATLASLYLLACPKVVLALELDYTPATAQESQAKLKLEQMLIPKVTSLSRSKRLTAEQQDVIYKVALGCDLSRYSSFKGWKFKNSDISALEELTGAESRSQGRDMKGETLETFGISKYVGSSMNSLLVKMYCARAKAIFASEDPQYWKLSPEDRKKSEGRIFSMRN